MIVKLEKKQRDAALRALEEKVPAATEQAPETAEQAPAAPEEQKEEKAESV